jgi:Tol biopolymer transport system component
VANPPPSAGKQGDPKVDISRACVVAGGFLFFGGAALPQQTTRVSVDSSGSESDGRSDGARISADGRFVVFQSAADDLVPNDTNGFVDVFVHDRVTGTTERVSLDSNGVEANGDSFGGSISADGQYVAFTSNATNWANLGLAWQNIFVRDRVAGTTELISVNQHGNAANSASFTGAISANGRYVVFQSLASNLVAGDANRDPDVFIRDRQLGVTELVSVDSAGVQGNKMSELPAVSADGMVVAFTSFATNLVAGDSNHSEDVFVHDRSTGTTERVSVDSNGVEVYAPSTYPSISADGRFVAFESYSFFLVANDNNNDRDVFLHDRATGATECVSVDSTGATANGGSRAIAGISADGRFVAFSSAATSFVAGDTNHAYDVFVRDRATGAVALLSVDSVGVQGDASSGGVDISANGETVVFFSDATNLVANDTNSVSDVFIRDRCVALRYEYGDGFPGSLGEPGLSATADPVLGSTFTVDVGNSLGAVTIGALFLGVERRDDATQWGGHLLVGAAQLFWISLQANGAALSRTVPNDPALCGSTFDLQVLELDPGATKGVSFTHGLELILGD